MRGRRRTRNRSQSKHENAPPSGGAFAARLRANDRLRIPRPCRWLRYGFTTLSDTVFVALEHTINSHVDDCVTRFPRSIGKVRVEVLVKLSAKVFDIRHTRIEIGRIKRPSESVSRRPCEDQLGPEPSTPRAASGFTAPGGWYHGQGVRRSSSPLPFPSREHEKRPAVRRASQSRAQAASRLRMRSSCSLSILP